MERNDLTRGDVVRTVATGYGRNAVEADGRVTEISCHAVGAGRLFRDGEPGGVRTILDIGGQDSKVNLFTRMIAKITPEKKILFSPWPKLTYQEAMDRFGKDALDMCFGMELVNVSDLVRDSEFRRQVYAVQKGIFLFWG